MAGSSDARSASAARTARRIVRSVESSVTPRLRPGERDRSCALHSALVRGLVDYALARKAILRDYQRGRLSRHQICDAHPELVRAARQVGDDIGIACPVCETEPLRLVSYAFGENLRSPSGKLWVGTDELDKLARAHDELKCYEVECCSGCGWNHLRRAFLVGRRHAG